MCFVNLFKKNKIQFLLIIKNSIIKLKRAYSLKNH